MLRESLRVLALSADQQIEYIESQQCHIDELALQLDDVVGALSQLPLGESLERLIREIDEDLDGMSGPRNARLWTPEGLKEPEWQRVRDLAKRALADDGWPYSV